MSYRNCNRTLHTFHISNVSHGETFLILEKNLQISQNCYFFYGKISEVCRIISAFGTGITDFELVDVPIEKVLKGLPKSLQDRTMSNIEQKQVEIRNSHQIKGIDMILRTRVENECCKH